MFHLFAFLFSSYYSFFFFLPGKMSDVLACACSVFFVFTKTSELISLEDEVLTITVIVRDVDG